MSTYKGSSGDDSYDLYRDHRERVFMGAGDDTVYVQPGGYRGDDKLDGGDGYGDTIRFYTPGTYTFETGSIKGFEKILLAGQGNYSLTLGSDIVATNQSLLIGTGLDYFKGSVTIDGSAVKSGALVLGGAAKNDVLIGGAGSDTLIGLDGHDQLTGNGGADYFQFYDNKHRSEGRSVDTTITDFQHGLDHIQYIVDSVTQFSDLTIVDTAQGAMISGGKTDNILLTGVAADGLNSQDFIFGYVHDAPISHEPPILAPYHLNLAHVIA